MPSELKYSDTMYRCLRATSTCVNQVLIFEPKVLKFQAVAGFSLRLQSQVQALTAALAHYVARYLSVKRGEIDGSFITVYAKFFLVGIIL